MVCTHSSRRENSHVSMEGGKVVGGWGMADRTEISKFKKVMRYFLIGEYFHMYGH